MHKQNTVIIDGVEMEGCTVNIATTPAVQTSDPLPPDGGGPGEGTGSGNH